MAYMEQDHPMSLVPFFVTSPFADVTRRFTDGFDGDLLKRLVEPESEEEAERRRALPRSTARAATRWRTSRAGRRPAPSWPTRVLVGPGRPEAER